LVKSYIEDARTQANDLYGEGAVYPYVLYVSPEGDPEEQQDIAAVYVVIDDCAYRMESLVHAVDVCFKIFLTFDVAFPPSTEQVWLFLQKQFYGIRTGVQSSLNVKSFIHSLTLQGK